jgi:hypothetical protein
MTQSKLFGQMFSVWSGLPGGLSGAAAPDRGPGVSPGFPLLSLAACGGEQKKEKEVFRGPVTLSPRQRSPNPGKGLAALCNPAFRQVIPDLATALLTP